MADTGEKLKELVAGLRTKKHISIDTESDSLYSYYYKLCLLQIESENLRAVVDPLKVDISPLSSLLESEKIEKIFHSAVSDIKVIKLAVNTEINNIFDVMLAAKYLGIRKCGLDNLVRQHFKIDMNKKFQKANWGKRPVNEGMLDYAILDVIYLKELRDMFARKLKDKGLIDEVREEFKYIAAMKPERTEFDPEGWQRTIRSRRLNAEAAGVFKHLYLEREKTAQNLNLPPFKVISEDLMLNLSRNPAHALGNLRRYKGVTHYVLSRHGKWMKKAIEKGMNDKCFRLENREVPAVKKEYFESVKRRQKKLKEWRRETAKKRGMLSEVIISGELIDRIAARNPDSLEKLAGIDGFLKIKLALYGEEILNCLRKCASAKQNPNQDSPSSDKQRFY